MRSLGVDPSMQAPHDVLDAECFSQHRAIPLLSGV